MKQKPPAKTSAILVRFRDALRAYCDLQRGRRAELARHLFGEGARAQAISVTEWIQGKTTPLGEHMLETLQWMPPKVRAKVFKTNRKPR